MPPERRLPSLLLLALLAAGCGPKDGTSTDAVAVARATPDPAAARAVLEDAAGSLDVPTRRHALGALIALSAQPAGAPWGERALWDPSPYVQRSAVDALGARLSEPESRAALQTFVARDGVEVYTRCSAASLLARTGDIQTLPAVQAALADAEAPWQEAPCALAAAQLGDTSALPILQAALREGELPLDLRFLQDLGRSGLTAAAPALQEGLALMEEDLELAAAAALLELGADEGEAMLRRALTGSDPQRQLEAVDFLLDASPEAAQRLLRRASGTDARAAADLALIGHGLAEPFFAVESLVSPDREVRQQAARALGRWLAVAGDAAPRRQVKLARAGLLQALQDDETSVRAEAIAALAAVGLAEDLEALAPLTASDSPQERAEAAAALLHIAARSAGP